MAPLHHPNLIQLHGGCDGPDKLCLVLEYCSNGDLEALYKRSKADGFGWGDTFYQITLGVAKCTSSRGGVRLRESRPWGKVTLASVPRHAGLDYLHHDVAGDTLIHRDIKPANILINDDIRAKVSDFGSSRRVSDEDADAALTMTRTGTPLYCACRWARSCAVPYISRRHQAS